MSADPTAKFVLSETIPRSSKTSINIGGIHVHLYGIKQLSPQQAEDTVVVFHIHGRTRTYKDAEDVAHQLLFETKNRPVNSKGLVIATFDNRNHGTRAIDTIADQDWKGGNEKHAQDMLSTIDGIVADMKTVMKFLEAYADGVFIPTEFIATGVSLGGHVAWNLLAEDPSITNAVIIVGSPNLTDMMLERLAAFNSTFTDVESMREWPRSVATLYRKRDESVQQISGRRILILNGALDPLVPNKFTVPWVEKYARRNNITFFSLQKTGHWLSYEMINHTVQWLQPILTPMERVKI